MHRRSVVSMCLIRNRDVVINFLSSLSSLITRKLQSKFNPIQINFDHARNHKEAQAHIEIEIAPPNVIDHTMQNEF